MSAYKVVKTQNITNQALLVQALQALGLHPEVGEQGKNALSLFGYLGDRRRNTCDVRINRSEVGFNSNDIGFAWDAETQSYQAVVSDYDMNKFHRYTLPAIQQQYAVAYLTQAARLSQFAGGQLRQTKLPDGSIQIEIEGFR